MKWKSDLEKSVVIENLIERNFQRCEDESTYLIQTRLTGISIGLQSKT
jgi:hypothetical protein